MANLFTRFLAPTFSKQIIISTCVCHTFSYLKGLDILDRCEDRFSRNSASTKQWSDSAETMCRTCVCSNRAKNAALPNALSSRALTFELPRCRLSHVYGKAGVTQILELTFISHLPKFTHLPFGSSRQRKMFAAIDCSIKITHTNPCIMFNTIQHFHESLAMMSSQPEEP